MANGGVRPARSEVADWTNAAARCSFSIATLPFVRDQGCGRPWRGWCVSTRILNPSPCETGFLRFWPSSDEKGCATRSRASRSEVKPETSMSMMALERDCIQRESSRKIQEVCFYSWYRLQLVRLFTASNVQTKACARGSCTRSMGLGATHREHTLCQIDSNRCNFYRGPSSLRMSHCLRSPSWLIMRPFISGWGAITSS